MLVRLLGRVTVDYEEDTRFDPPSGPQRRLLSLLALRSGRPVTSETICDLFDLSAGAVRTTVSRLRKQLGEDVLVTESGGYLLRAETDAQQFQAQLGQARSMQFEEAAAALSRALELFSGSPLEEFADEPWALPEVARLNEMRASAVEDLVEIHIGSQGYDDALALLRSHLAEFPYRDHPHEQLMRALALSGRHVEALRAFQEYRSRLIDEVGVEPGEAIRALDQQISLGDGVSGGTMSVAAPARPAADVSLTNLPELGNEFVGREADLITIAEGLSDARLVTLLGPGGVGKTRLAVQSLQGQVGVFSDGVWLIELAECSTSADIVRTFASVLGLAAAETADELATDIAGRNLLVAFDNCEHVLDQLRPLVETLLARTTRLRMLATSRMPINVVGERLIRMDPLDPSTAAELYLARASDTGVHIDETDHPIVLEICERLDGIPLAVELAAATSRVFAPAELLQRLDRRFDVLKGGQRGRVAGRHASLRAAIDSSYDALLSDSQAFFTRLSVFAGEFPFSAIDAASEGLDASSFDLVAELIDRSLLVSSKGSSGLTTFRMLETLRQYGIDRLKDDGGFDEAVELHITWSEQVVSTEVSAAYGASESASLGELVAVAPNVRLAAVRLIEQGDRDRAAAMVAQLSDVAYAANALAALAEPLVARLGTPAALSADTDLIELHLAGIELTRRATAGATTGRVELARDLAGALRKDHPGTLHIPTMLIATALRVGPPTAIAEAAVQRSQDDSVDLAERARLLTAAGMAAYYGDTPPDDFELVSLALAAAEAAGMRRLTIAAASMACIAGVRLKRPSEAAQLAGPVLSQLGDQIVHPSIMTSGLVSMYTEVALRAELDVADRFLGVRRAGPTLRGDYNRLGLALARLVQHHGGVALALRAVGACERSNRSDFSNQQVQTIIDAAREGHDDREVDALLAAGAVSEQSDLYREMWADLEPLMLSAN